MQIIFSTLGQIRSCAKGVDAMKTNGLHLSEAYANMTPDELTRLSPEEFTAFVIVHFEHQGYTLEECQLAPGGQLLLFRLERALCVVYCLPNPYLGGQIWEVTSVEVAWCVSAAENLTAARGYIITAVVFLLARRNRLDMPVGISC